MEIRHFSDPKDDEPETEAAGQLYDVPSHVVFVQPDDDPGGPVNIAKIVAA